MYISQYARERRIPMDNEPKTRRMMMPVQLYRTRAGAMSRCNELIELGHPGDPHVRMRNRAVFAKRYMVCVYYDKNMEGNADG